MARAPDAEREMDVIRENEKTKVIRVKVSELCEHPSNEWIKANPKRVDRLAKSMERRGFDESEPIIVGGHSLQVEDGRHRVLAAKKAGVEYVIAIRPSSLHFGSPTSRFSAWVAKVRRAAGFEPKDQPEVSSDVMDLMMFGNL